MDPEAPVESHTTILLNPAVRPTMNICIEKASNMLTFVALLPLVPLLSLSSSSSSADVGPQLLTHEFAKHCALFSFHET